MKKETSQSAFFNLRLLLGLALCLCGLALSIFAAGVGSGKGNPKQQQQQQRPQDRPGSQQPEVMRMVGPVHQDLDLRNLPYQPSSGETEEVRHTRYPFPRPGGKNRAPDIIADIVNSALLPQPLAPSPLLTFDAIDSNLSGCGCLPPDTDGDVGPNHYIASENSSIMVFDKVGNALAGPVSYNSFFSALGTGTACGNNQNQGDGVVFYDHISDRWVVTDFAFPTSGATNYQCIGVSKTSDPVAGGWYLYAVLVDPANPGWIGDYPKFGLWPDAYYLSVNLFLNSGNQDFEGVRVFAFDRSAMINGGPANTVAFTIAPGDLGDQYSLLPATFRTGSPPPAGQSEWFMSVNSSSVAGTVENEVFVRRFHVDFVTPALSTFGVGATAHSPDGIITVNGFVDAFTDSSSNLAPNGTNNVGQWLDTLGDKLMYPLVYQNLAGVESIYSSQTINNTGPTAIRWYQFDMTGNTIPPTPTQQQDYNNGNDGLARWMPSINVDGSGNVAIGYSASSATINPGIRYAGRLASDPPGMLGPETVMTAATGHQTDGSGRWGDYSSMFVDPTDNCTFYHTNEYYSVTAGASWRTRVGAFKYGVCTGGPNPTPTPTPTATPSATPTATPNPTPIPTPTPVPSPTPSPTPPVSAGPVTVTATAVTTGPTDYPTVKAAFDAINLGTHQGDINVWILGDTVEAATATLNASGVGSASYTSLLMLPNGVRTVTGNLAAPLINLDGAKNVRIDGYGSLTLSNTNTGATAGTSTIRFISSTAAAGGARNNIVANCTILGSSTVATGTAGGNILFSTTVSSGTNSVGNSNNLVINNNIGPAGANLPTKCISAVGTAGNNTLNRDNVIDNNNIFDFFNATATAVPATTGIDVRTGNQNWVIRNNRIYQTATRTFTTAAGQRYSGITFSGTTGTNGNFLTISGNRIGFGAANGTGTTTITGTGLGLGNEVRGIDIQGASTLTATSVQGNTISGINQTSNRASTTTGFAAFAGIAVSTSAGASANGAYDIGTVTGNAIGSMDGSSTIVINASSITTSTAPVFGILSFSGSSNNISNNQMGAITIQGAGTVTGFRGIFPGATAATTQTINNNVIGGLVAGGAITDTQVGSYGVYGIQTSTAAVSINGNTIRNLVANSNGAVVAMSGIAMSSTSTTAASNISQNTVYSLNNSAGAGAGALYAIDVTMPTSAAVTGNLVNRNFVHSVTATSTTAAYQVWGIVMRGQGTATLQNNMVRLGIDSAGNTDGSDASLIGIRDIAGATASYYYNSVYIGGSGVTSTTSTFAFNSSVVTNARNFVDNVFFNARDTVSGGGKNYAITVGGTAPNPAGLTSNYNDLFANGTGGFVGLFNGVDQLTLANWQAATGQEANSLSVNPQFIAPDGSAGTVDLHLQPFSPVIGAATPVTSTLAEPLNGVIKDFDTDVRNPVTPDMGADERIGYFGPIMRLSKTADATSVLFGSQIGFKVALTNAGNLPATGVSVTDNLPSGPGISWSIDGANTDPGWSINGSPPNQVLVFGPTAMINDSITHVHVISSTAGSVCTATYNNTVSFTSTNAGSGTASASVSTTPNVPGAVYATQDFDGVTAPALPAGWVAVNVSGTTPLWVTSTVTPDTAPNDAFINNPATVSDKQLTSSTFVVQTATDRLSFRNFYNLEAGFDGGVLEISINGGAFADIVTAGGSFVSGGYNATIPTGFSNPLANRAAWSGNSNGYITTVATLPPSAAGQNVQFKWRMGSDNSTSGVGWRIDTIQLQNAPVCPAASLSISKTADAASVSSGSQIGFTVTLNNTGPAAATGLIVTDSLPAGTGVSWTIDAGNTSAGWSVSGLPPNQSLVYTPTALAGNTSTTAHVVSNTGSGSCGTYSNTASFTTANDGSGSDSASTTVDCAALSITKTADAASVSAGSQIGFTVTLNNSSGGAATGLSVSDNLPAGTGVNWTIDAGNTDPGWSVSGAPPNQSLVYSPTTLAGNTSTTAHVVSNTDSGSCGTYSNTASFTTSNDGSGSDSASETVLCANITITKTADAATVSAGAQIGFTVTLNNNNSGTATGLGVGDSLPPGTGVNWTIDAGNTDPGWSVSGAPPNQSLVYSPNVLPGNTSTTAHVVSSTTTSSCGTYNNTATFSTSNDGSGSDSASVTVDCANVSITKTADAGNVNAGQQIGFNVTLSNSDAGTALGLSVSDSLPAGSGVNWTIDAGNTDPGWSVSGSPPNQSLVYSPTTLAGNTTTSAHVVSATTGGSCGSYNNTASFSTSNAGSGSDSASVTVNCASVSITKTADAGSVNAGSQIGFTVSLNNSGTGTATGLSVSDNLPSGGGVNWTIDAGNTSPGWSVSGSPPNQSLVYAPNSLPGNASTAAHVVSNTTSASCGNYSNTASFTTSNDGSGSDSAAVTVNCANIAITKTADAGNVNAGAQIGFTVKLNNTGAGTATGLSVTDSLPFGTGVTWTIDAGNTNPGWAITGAPPNQSLVYTPTTLAGNTMTMAHVVSSTTTASCKTYNNTASFTTSNDGSGSASAATTVTCPSMVTIKVRATPTGRSFIVDGITYTTQQTFSWVAGSNHTLATTSPQSAGTGIQYVWTGWNDGGAISHVVAPTTNKNYETTFKLQYFLTMNAGSGGQVLPASGYFDAGSVVTIKAKANAAFHFVNWTGSGTGSFTGTANPASVTMGSPITETANFVHN